MIHEEQQLSSCGGMIYLSTSRRIIGILHGPQDISDKLLRIFSDIMQQTSEPCDMPNTKLFTYFLRERSNLMQMQLNSLNFAVALPNMSN
ncbi:hypothetical protein D3C77_347720 [compost metagenome]